MANPATSMGSSPTSASMAKADGRDHQRHPDEVGGFHAPRDHRHQHRRDHQHHGRRQQPQPGHQRREALDQLEVLRDEQVDAADHGEREQLDQQRRAERTAAEHGQVQQRVGQPELPPDEDHAERDTDDDRDRAPAFDAVDHGQHGGEGERDARQVEAARVGVAVLGQQGGRRGHQQHHHRRRDQEDRAPPEPFEQQPVDDRADGDAHGEAGGPQRDGRGPLAGVAEHRADERERRRAESGARDPQERAGGDHQLGVGRVGGEDRRGAERGRTDHEQFATADAVAEGAHGDQEPGDHEAVDVDDPEQLGAAGGQVGVEMRGGQVEHGGVHAEQHGGQRQHGQPEPLPGTRQRAGLDLHAPNVPRPNYHTPTKP